MKFAPKFLFVFAAITLLSACSQTTNPQEPLTFDEDEMSSWPVYSNYGFEFQYPDDWVVEDFEGLVTLTSPGRAEFNENADENTNILPDVSIKIYDSLTAIPENESGQALSEWAMAEKEFFDGIIGERDLNGETAYILYNLEEEEVETTFIFVEHAGKVYDINFDVPAQNDMAFVRQNMFSTFAWTL